jgi:hypothetical protein
LGVCGLSENPPNLTKGLVAGAGNVPNALIVPFRIELVHAAGEVVPKPVYLDAMLQRAPKKWDQPNLEAAIETHIIEGHPGPPTVIAVETW